MNKDKKKLVAIIVSTVISVAVSAIGCALGVPARELLPNDTSVCAVQASGIDADFGLNAQYRQYND